MNHAVLFLNLEFGGKSKKSGGDLTLGTLTYRTYDKGLVLCWKSASRELKILKCLTAHFGWLQSYCCRIALTAATDISTPSKVSIFFTANMKYSRIWFWSQHYELCARTICLQFFACIPYKAVWNKEKLSMFSLCSLSVLNLSFLPVLGGSFGERSSRC